LATQGTDISSALQLALDHVETDEEKFKVIVLVSDGEDHEGKAIELAQYAKKQGIIVHTLGVGTLAGGPIPILDKHGNRIDFKKDRNGNVVTTTLNDGSLSEIARLTGGKYIRVENQNNAIGPLIEEISEMEKRELKSHVFSEYEDRYQVFALIALLLLLVEFITPTRTSKETKWEGKFAKRNS
jgi:Ca-activated chloride channel family protein